MFWQEVQMTSSPINTLLENENVTLTELLKEDDILQECKTLNKQLVEFLVRPSTILELIQLIVQEPPNNIDLRQQYRNSAMACEIIASRVPTLSENIASDPKILGKLYSFLDSKPPLNPLLASFFAKTIEVLFTHSAAHQDWYTYQFMCLQVIEYFKTCPNFLPQILEHIGTSGIMNSLQFITQVPVGDMMNNILTWLDSQNLIEKLIALICGTYTEIYVKKAVDNTISEEIVNLNEENSKQQEETSESKLNESECVATEEAETGVSDGVVLNGPAGTKNNDEALPIISSEKLDERLLTSRSANASQLICNFITKGREPNTDLGHRFNNPLLAKCLSAEIINQLLESMFSCPENNRKNAICNGIQVLLTLLNDETGQVQQPIVNQEEIHRIAEIITPWLPKFVNILTDPPIQSQGITKDNAVGVARLTVAHLIVVMVDTDSPAVASAMLDHQVFTLLLDMFFQFQWNNFLHAHVEGIIEKALKAPSQKEVYKKHLFLNCKLIERIYSAWEENVTPDKARPGYMGHMIQIANHIERSLCSDSEDDNLNTVINVDLWNKLLVRLNDINTLYSTCLGGHHPADNNSQGSQPLPQECYTTEYLHHDINFNDGEDIITDTMNELPDNSEQMFSSMCENTSSSMGGNNTADHWTHANIKNITGENMLEDNDNGSVDKTPASLGEIEDSAYFDLLINFTGHEGMNAFNKWLRNNDCPDWIDDNGRSPISPPVPSIGENNSSPWGDISNLTNEQSGWADFGNLQETAGISNVPNTFTCEAFAAFDQENVPSSKIMTDDKTATSQTDILAVAQEEIVINAKDDSGMNKNNEISIVNDLNTIKIEQIQSETLSDTVISVGGGTPTFADIVRQQPGAQKVVVNQVSESEEPKISSEGSASDQTRVESVNTYPDTKTTLVDIDSLSQSLANISLAGKIDDTSSNICELPTDSVDKPLSSAEEAVPTSLQDSELDNIDPTVDNQR